MAEGTPCCQVSCAKPQEPLPAQGCSVQVGLGADGGSVAQDPAGRLVALTESLCWRELRGVGASLVSFQGVIDLC